MNGSFIKKSINSFKKLEPTNDKIVSGGKSNFKSNLKQSKVVIDEIKDKFNFNKNIADSFESKNKKYKNLDHTDIIKDIKLKNENAEFGRNLVSNNIIKFDIHTPKLVNVYQRTIIHMAKNDNTALRTIANNVSQLERFQREVSFKFYEELQTKTMDISSTLESTIENVKTYSDNRIKAIESNLIKNDFQAQMSLFRFDAIKGLTDTYKTVRDLLKSDFVKGIIGGMLDEFVASPIKMVLKFVIGIITPKSVKNFLNEVGNVFTSVNDSIAFGLENAKNSDNVVLSTIAKKLMGNEKEVHRGSYQKQKVPYDGVTRRAITRTIPTLLSKILTSLNPVKYPSELIYDYEKGSFVNKVNVDRYNRRYSALEKSKPLNIEELKKLERLRIDYEKDVGRFSNEEMEFDNFEEIFNSEYKKDKWTEVQEKIKKLTKKETQQKIAKSITGKTFFGKIKSKFDFPWVNKLTDKVKKLNVWISGSLKMDDVLEKFTNNALKMGNSILVEGSNLMKALNNVLVKPIITPLKDIIKSGLSIVSSLTIEPIATMAKGVLESIVGKYKKKGETLFDAALRLGSASLRKNIVRPLTRSFLKFKKNIKTHFNKVLIEPLVKFLVDNTKKIRESKFYENASLAVNRVQEIEPEFNLGQSAPGNTVVQPKNMKQHLIDADAEYERKDKKRNILANSFNVIKDNIKLLSKLTNVHAGNIERAQKNLKDRFESTIEIMKTQLEVDKSVCNFLVVNSINPSRIVELEDMREETWGDGILRFITRHTIGTMLKIKNFKMTEDLIDRIRHKLIRLSISAMKIVNFTTSVANVVSIPINLALRVGSKIATTLVRAATHVVKGFAKLGIKLFKSVLKIAPKIINVLSKATIGVIRISESFLKFSSKMLIKLTGGLATLGLNAIGGIGLVVGKLLDKVANKLFGRIGNRRGIIVNFIGGHINEIKEEVTVYEVTKEEYQLDRIKAEREQDEQDTKKASKIASFRRKIIKNRITKRNNLVTKMLGKITDTVIDGASYIVSAITGIMLGGNFGEKLANLFSTRKQLNEVMNVYIVGGSLDNNGGLNLGNLTDIDGDGDSDIGDIGNSGSKKGILSKAKKFITGKNGKKLAIGALVAGTAAVGYSAYKKNKNEKEEEPKEEPVKKETKVEPTKPKNTVEENLKRKGENSTLSLANTIAQTNTNKIAAFEKEQKLAKDMERDANTFATKLNASNEKEISVLGNAFGDMQKVQSKAEKVNTEERRIGVDSLVDPQTATVDAEVDLLVQRYRKYIKDDSTDEILVYKKLNLTQQETYMEQKVSQNALSGVYDNNERAKIVKQKKTVGSILVGFLDKLTGVPLIAGFSLKQVFGGIKKLTSRVVEGAKSLWDKVTNSKLVQGIKGFFSKLFGGSNGSNNETGTNVISAGNIDWPTGNMKLGEKLVKYAMAFLPQGKINYSQPLRDKIDNQGNRADCSSFVRHVYKTVTGINPGNTSREQDDAGTKVSSVAELREGDILWKSGHVGLYCGGNKYIDVGGPTNGSNDPKYKDITSFNYFTMGRRVINPDQMVDNSLIDPNTALTGLSSAGGSNNTNTTTEPTTYSFAPRKIGGGESSKGDSAEYDKQSKISPSNSEAMSVFSYNIGDSSRICGNTQLCLSEEEMNLPFINSRLSDFVDTTNEQLDLVANMLDVRNSIYTNDTNTVKLELTKTLINVLIDYEESTNTIKNNDKKVIINNIKNMVNQVEDILIDEDIITNITQELLLLAQGY